MADVVVAEVAQEPPVHAEKGCHLCDRKRLMQAEGGDVPRDATSDKARASAASLTMYSESDEEAAHGRAGKIVKRLGKISYVLFFLVPLTFVAVMFAIVPLGNPLEATFKEQWVFLLISNTSVTAAMAYLYNATFLSMAKVARPFRTSLIPIVAVVLAGVAVLAPVLLLKGVINFLGIVALTVLYLSLFASMLVAYSDLRPQLHSFFRRFMLLVILYIPLITGYILAYRSASSQLQSGLTFILAFITFIYRRVMLSRLDPFPLDLSQLLSGFWVQNIADTVQILAFTEVRSPKVFAATWFSNSFGNFAFLWFISDLWIFKIRPNLKNYVVNGAKGNFPIPPAPPFDYSFDPVNRGHDNNVGGYRRRQFRFFFYRLLSQTVAMLLYLGISPMLRFGLNKEYTPFVVITKDEYRNSVIYASANLVFIFAVAVLGYTILKKYHHETFHEIRQIHRHDFVHHTMVGHITAIITHNLILTIAIIMSQYCIFASFRECVLTGPAPLDLDRMLEL